MQEQTEMTKLTSFKSKAIIIAFEKRKKGVLVRAAFAKNDGPVILIVLTMRNYRWRIMSVTVELL